MTHDAYRYANFLKSLSCGLWFQHVIAGSSIVGSASWILPFTSGGFLYIALVTVLPDLLNQEETFFSGMKKMLIIFLGVGSMCAVNLLHS